jgi:hypothetical protein
VVVETLDNRLSSQWGIKTIEIMRLPVVTCPELVFWLGFLSMRFISF